MLSLSDAVKSAVHLLNFDLQVITAESLLDQVTPLWRLPYAEQLQAKEKSVLKVLRAAMRWLSNEWPQYNWKKGYADHTQSFVLIGHVDEASRLVGADEVIAMLRLTSCLEGQACLAPWSLWSDHPFWMAIATRLNTHWD